MAYALIAAGRMTTLEHQQRLNEIAIESHVRPTASSFILGLGADQAFECLERTYQRGTAFDLSDGRTGIRPGGSDLLHRFASAH